jgi:hypothetical protein
MRWLCVLAIVGVAAQAHADGCRVTTPSGQVLFVREVSATLAAPSLRLPPPTATLATAPSAKVGLFVSAPLHRQIGLDTVGLQTAQPHVILLQAHSRLIVDLELRIDDCAPTDA